MIRLHSEGWSIASIAAYMQTTRPTIYATLQRWAEEGVAGLEEKSQAHQVLVGQLQYRASLRPPRAPGRAAQPRQRCSRGSCMPRNLRAISTHMDISGSTTGGSLGKMGWPESRFRCGSTKARSKLSTRRWPSRCMNSEYGVRAYRPENGTRRFGALALSRMSSLFEEHGVSRGPTYLTGSRL